MKDNNKNLIHHEKRDTFRLNKYISDYSNYSRREADRLIKANKVTVNGKIPTIGEQVSIKDIVKVNNVIIKPSKKSVYIALNKPVGIISTTDINISGNLTTFMNYGEAIFPIGRLDKDSTGLLLMTNDGDIVNKILREENGHDKEYIVKVNKKIDYKFISKMEKGVIIFNPVSNKNQKTKPTKLKQIDDYTFKIILQQGLNRQIRRMTQTLGYKVVSLKRIRVMNVHLGTLAVGKWRYLTDRELIEINKAINKNNKV